jgi:hypothetical protein
MYAAFNDLQRLEITLYTDALITRGSIRTRQRRVTDILNLAEDPFLILEDVSVVEFGARGEPTTPITAAFAQINLDAVLFAVATTRVEPIPELRTPKSPQEAIVSIPPFRVTGTMHLLPSDGNIRAALSELHGRFLPITDATFWSDTVGEPRQEAVLVAVNHRRAQILAPHGQPGPRGGVEGSGGGADSADAGSPGRGSGSFADRDAAVGSGEPGYPAADADAGPPAPPDPWRGIDRPAGG